MSRCTLEITVAGVGSCDQTTITATASYTDAANPRGGTYFDNSNSPLTIAGPNTAYLYMGNEGGTVHLTWQVNGGASQTMQFTVRGTNPPPAYVDADVNNDGGPWYFESILNQESSYVQYRADGTPNVAGNPDGIGIAQIDGQRNATYDRDYWSYGLNIYDALEGVLPSTSALADNAWNTYLSNWASDYGVNATNGPDPTNFPNGCYFAYPSANYPGSQSYGDAERMTRYNGINGSSYYPSGYFTTYTVSTPSVAGYWTVQNQTRTYVSDVCNKGPR